MENRLTDAELEELRSAYTGPEWRLGTDATVVRVIDEVRRLRAVLMDIEQTSRSWGDGGAQRPGEGPSDDADEEDPLDAEEALEVIQYLAERAVGRAEDPAP